MAISKTIGFTDMSSGGDGEIIVAWGWEFFDQDGTTILGATTEQNPTYTFPSWGQYFARLSVTNSCGVENTTDILCVSTGCPTPVASFTHTGETCI